MLDLCGEESDEIVIAPNPTKGTFTLTYPVAMENEEAFEVKIYTSSGQLVADGIYIEGNGSEEFDMTNLPNGVYLVAVGGAGKITHAKVVKN
ncbi:MAG: T9SS type A sorting domain-containing protein [bacterium]|nr:T9SS type A sorting domain-containing protein [bacterium]